ncbi:MAG: hypothetical protein LRZ98_02050 [Candidatus Pacebacteria bacterium]|nr:hypothetical protein [Candidatus Paceibacterota bacterium]
METAIEKLVSRIIDVVLDPIGWILVGLSIIMFFYGFVIFLINPESDEQKKQGKQHMLYGIIGIFIIFSV